jgi:hypothetical protein
LVFGTELNYCYGGLKRVSLKYSIKNYIRKIEEYPKNVRQNFVLEAQLLAGEMSNVAPLGYTGRLRDSIHTIIYNGALKSTAYIISELDYAQIQATGTLRHVPKKELGKKSVSLKVKDNIKLNETIQT